MLGSAVQDATRHACGASSLAATLAMGYLRSWGADQEPTLTNGMKSFSEPLGGRYVIERELGRGGMAVVYLATDTTTGESVALKLLDAEVGAAVGADRFRREIRIASDLKHPNILSVLDAGESDGQLFFTMPVVTGESLHALMTREAQLSITEAVRIAREVAAALMFAHQSGVVHRDVKPENILMQDGHAMLADFGIARASSDLRATQVLTRTGMSLGTPTYMSPEQAVGDRELDGRSDQYSLACALYEMLAGQAPFTAKTAQGLMARHMLENVPSLAIVRSNVPQQVEDAIVRAMAKVPADRFETIADFAEALGTAETWKPSTGMYTRAFPVPPAPPVQLKRRWFTRRRAMGALAGVAIVAVAAASAWYVRRPVNTVPSVMLAITPFNPLRPEFALWQEGMVDLLARNLDGLGPLGAVSPTVAIRGWNGRKADRQSARALAERTDAQYAVFGSVNSAPGNLVQLTTSLLDVAADTLWEGSWTGLDVKGLADSATKFVVMQLSKRHRIGASRESPLGATSLEALKSFLQGEQQFRQTSWEAALGHYTRAAALDTAFPLPLRRMGQIVAFQRDNADSLGRSYALRAGQLNHGLAPRDSFLVVSDSLFASLALRQDELSDGPMLSRLFATLGEASRRYPNDPEVWYALGEARAHLGYGTVVDVTDEAVFDAFERAIALDSGFAPAYIHAVELAFQLRGVDAGRTHARAYLALSPTDREAAGIRLVDRLTDPTLATSVETARMLDSLPNDVLASALNAVARWPDSAATSLALIRAVARRPATSASHVADSLLVYNYLPLLLAYRGRLREAYQELGNRRSQLFAELVLLGGIETDSAKAVFSRWLVERSPRARAALPFWAAQNDVASINQFLARADSSSRRAKGQALLSATHDAGAARAYLKLAAHDTTASLQSFAQLSDTLCLTCYVDRLTEARLLAARKQWVSADRLLRQRVYAAITPIEILMAMERGRVALQLKDTQTAARSFALVVNAWERGDPELQSMVEEARRALRTLSTKAVRVSAVAGGSAR